jgi:hypothetical protein
VAAEAREHLAFAALLSAAAGPQHRLELACQEVWVVCSAPQVHRLALWGPRVTNDGHRVRLVALAALLLLLSHQLRPAVAIHQPSAPLPSVAKVEAARLRQQPAWVASEPAVQLAWVAPAPPVPQQAAAWELAILTRAPLGPSPSLAVPASISPDPSLRGHPACSLLQPRA